MKNPVCFASFQPSVKERSTTFVLPECWSSCTDPPKKLQNTRGQVNAHGIALSLSKVCVCVWGGGLLIESRLLWRLPDKGGLKSVVVRGLSLAVCETRTELKSPTVHGVNVASPLKKKKIQVRCFRDRKTHLNLLQNERGV